MSQKKKEQVLPNAFDPLCLLTIADALKGLDRGRLEETFTYLEEEGGEAAICEDIEWMKQEFPTTAPDFDFLDFKSRVRAAWDDDNALRILADELDKVNTQRDRADKLYDLRYEPKKSLAALSKHLEQEALAEEISDIRP